MIKNRIIRCTQLLATIGAMASASTLSAQIIPDPKPRFKREAEEHDPIQFLLKRDKQVALTSTQTDSLKALHKELIEAEKPIFKEADRYFDAHPTPEQAARAFGGTVSSAPGGRGRVSVPASAGRPPATEAPSQASVQLFQTQIFVKQDLFRDRARALLNDTQNHNADSIRTALDAERARKSQ